MNYVSQENIDNIVKGMSRKLLESVANSAVIGDTTPVGTIISFMGTQAPDFYLICDGTTYNIADYKELADFIEFQFGTVNYFGGDGTTTFAVPDLQGEFLRGSGTNSHTNQGSGTSVGVHQDGTTFGNTAEIVSGSSTTLRVITPSRTQELENFDSHVEYSPTGGTFNTFTPSSTASYGGEIASIVTSRPTNTSVLYCIKYTKAVKSTSLQNYSTEEQRIGTWVDGKPLYQKTYEITSPSTAGTAVSIILLDTSIDVVSMDGHLLPMMPLNFTYDSTNYVVTWQSGENYNIYMKVSSHYVNDSGYITLQYTKTTD